MEGMVICINYIGVKFNQIQISMNSQARFILFGLSIFENIERP
jgi:hypothetical protein